MGCTRISLRQLGRKKYPYVRYQPRYEYISNKKFEIENIILEISNSDTVTVEFDSPFSVAPSVIANFVSMTQTPNVNIYVESVSTTQAIIRTSAPITGKIHVHAMYIYGCDNLV